MLLLPGVRRHSQTGYRWEVTGYRVVEVETLTWWTMMPVPNPMLIEG